MCACLACVYWVIYGANLANIRYQVPVYLFLHTWMIQTQVLPTVNYSALLQAYCTLPHLFHLQRQQERQQEQQHGNSMKGWSLAL